MRWLGIAVVVAGLGCGDDGTGLPEQTVFGGDRPAELFVPPDYDHEVPAPLVLVLHGYGINGVAEYAYARIDGMVDEHGALAIAPDGTPDADGNLFWNTGHAGCEIGAGTALPDDLGYLTALVDEVSGVWNVDPKRVYVFGHSNGGFMAHRLACDRADRFAAIVSLAGAPALEEADCAPSEPVSVLQLHGDADGTVEYGGGDDIIGVACPYPGATETAARWAGHDGCDAALTDTGDRLDLATTPAGDETRVERHDGCGGPVAVELWTMEGGGHIPSFRPDVYQPLWAFFAAHPKP